MDFNIGSFPGRNLAKVVGAITGLNLWAVREPQAKPAISQEV